MGCWIMKLHYGDHKLLYKRLNGQERRIEQELIAGSRNGKPLTARQISMMLAETAAITDLRHQVDESVDCFRQED